MWPEAYFYLVTKYECVKKHISELYGRAKEWALCFRNGLMTRDNNTNNYSEVTIRQFKDIVLYRVKACSVVQLFDFFTTRLEAYFERRIASVLNNRKENYLKSKHFIPLVKIKPLVCSKTSRDNFFIVENTDNGHKYTVDMDQELCTCPVGKNRAPCRHQFAVVTKFNLTSSQFLPFHDEEAKIALHKIMTTTAPPPGWYASLKGGPSSLDAMVHLSVGVTESCTVQEENEQLELEPGAISDSNETERASKALEAWTAVDSYVRSGLKERRDTFLSAIEQFTKQFQRAQSLSENSVLSAMHEFNKSYTGVKALRRSSYINVNRLSVRRRKTALGGRKCAQTGRPPKSAFTGEHGYANCVRKVPAWDKVHHKKPALPHSITKRIKLTAQKMKRGGLPTTRKNK